MREKRYASILEKMYRTLARKIGEGRNIPPERLTDLRPLVLEAHAASWDAEGVSEAEKSRLLAKKAANLPSVASEAEVTQ